MIRKLLNGDIDRVADIWLKTNLKAHYFISNQYWKSNYELVKEMMSQSEVYVFEVDKMIQGFVGLNDEYIEGIFVSDEMQSCGIGKLLLDYVKDKKVSLPAFVDVANPFCCLPSLRDTYWRTALMLISPYPNNNRRFTCLLVPPEGVHITISNIRRDSRY